MIKKKIKEKKHSENEKVKKHAPKFLVVKSNKKNNNGDEKDTQV